MFKSITLLWLVLGCVQLAQAQADFQPGYLVPLSGDTVRGEVAVLGTQRSLRRCVFRPAATAAPTTYLPGQVKGYGIWKMKDYRSGRVPVADTARQLRFLEVLAQGPATLLFSSDDNNDSRFFLQRAGRAEPEELRRIVRTQVTNGRVYKQEINQYQQTLLVAFADQPDLAPRIRRARFSPADLIDLVARYNARQGGASQVSSTGRAHTGFRLGVVAGYPLSSRLQLASSSGLGFYNTSIDAAASPVFGLELATNNSRLSRKLWLHLGLFYQQRRYAGRAGRGKGSTSTVDDYYDLAYDATGLRVPLSLRFEAATGRFRPLLELGVTANFRTSTAQNEVVIHYTISKSSYTQPLFLEPRTYEQGFLAGVGLAAPLANGHQARLLLRYELTNGFSSAAAISSTCHTVSALLGYNLISK